MIPYFSIVVPLYNKVNSIIATLDSVMTQTFDDFEVIVVDDGSTDESLKKVHTIEDPRLQVFPIKNQGVSHARNFGIQKARSERIVFLDADDWWYEHHLRELKDLFEAFPNCGLYGTAYQKTIKNTIIPSRYKAIPRESPWKGEISDYFYHSSINSLASSSSIAVPKSTFDVVGYFNENYNSGEDTDMWIRIALKFPMAFSNRVSVIHRQDTENNITQSQLSSRKHIDLNAYVEEEQHNKSLKTYLDLNRLSAAIQYKMAGDKALAKSTYEAIEKAHLSTAQKMVYHCPRFLMKALLKTRNVLRSNKLDLRLFR